MANGEDCVSHNLSAERYTSKIPVRIKSGCFRENCLFITTNNEEREIAWSSIKYVCLGAIEEMVSAAEAPKSGMRNVIRKLFFGDKPQDEQVKPQKRIQYILDIYVDDRDAAYRFDSSNINYKAFLGEVSYMSFHNFKKLVKELSDRAKDSYFNRSAVALLIKRQDKIQRHPSVYDFELDSQNSRANLQREVHWSALTKQTDYLFEDLDNMDGREEKRGIHDSRIRVVDGILEEAQSELEASKESGEIEIIETEETVEEIEEETL